ncbi:MAG: ABC transporter ATP-binding protein [Desulfobacteraceae bacterium]|nr:ABC transporter ATP-binding protein [Desulfobacteraceae bacterium]
MLEVKNLDVAYGHAKALHDVSLKIEKGQMAFMIGRNGAGKTTFLKTVIGLLKPLKGSITYQGHEISDRPPEELYMEGIRYVAQEKKVFGNLTVRENIEIAAYTSQEPLDRAIEKVAEIYPKLKDFLNTKAGQLSGGQRQILLVGRALVGNPKFLLIDEPTQGLAAIIIEEIRNILRNLKGSVSAVIVEQNLAMVNRLADQIYVLKEGKLVKEIKDMSKISDTRELEEYL